MSSSHTVPQSDTPEGRLLAEPRFELMPFDSMEDQLSHLPDGATIAITTSPSLGLDTTVEWSVRAAEQGYNVVPHLAARYVKDDDQLDEILTQLTDAGITDVFIPGGDREEPVGEFESSYELLTAMDRLGHEFEEVGITGYPEGHDFISDETLAAVMDKKAPYATYVTTQLCYNPDAIVDWIETIRDRGVELPVEVGIPGVMKYQKLLKISRKVGVGDSIRFLQKTAGITGFIRQFIRSRGKYNPDELVEGLSPYYNDPEYKLRGLHVYSFNRVPDTESWRMDRLED